jgi:ATP-dependent Lon protease
VLPIGGVREKVLAAQRAGLKRVILPRENESELGELPADAREAMEFVLADELPEVLAAALDGKSSARLRRAQGSERRAALGR